MEWNYRVSIKQKAFAATDPLRHKQRKRTLNDQNFTTTFSVDQTPKEAFDAINNVRGWWSGEIEGSADKLGDQFTYRYEDLHYTKQKVTEVIPGKKVVWLVLDGGPNFVKDKTEWKGTEIAFEISKKGDKTEIRFTHLGLVPELECFDEWSNAWGSYIEGSLRNLIISGKTPGYHPARPRSAGQLNEKERTMMKG